MELPTTVEALRQVKDPVTQAVDVLHKGGSTEGAKKLLGHVYEANVGELQSLFEDMVQQPSGKHQFTRIGVGLSLSLALFGGMRLFKAYDWANMAMLGAGIGGAAMFAWKRRSGEVKIDDTKFREAFMDKAFRESGWYPDHKLTKDDQIWPEYVSSSGPDDAVAANDSNNQILLEFRRAFGYENVSLPKRFIGPSSQFYPEYSGEADEDAIQYMTALETYGSAVAPNSLSREEIEMIELRVQQTRLAEYGTQETERQRLEAEEALRAVQQQRQEDVAAAATTIQEAIDNLPGVDWIADLRQGLVDEKAKYEEGGELYAEGDIPEEPLAVFQGKLEALAERGREASNAIDILDELAGHARYEEYDQKDFIATYRAALISWALGELDGKPDGKVAVGDKGRTQDIVRHFNGWKLSLK